MQMILSHIFMEYFICKQLAFFKDFSRQINQAESS